MKFVSFIVFTIKLWFLCMCWRLGFQIWSFVKFTIKTIHFNVLLLLLTFVVLCHLICILCLDCIERLDLGHIIPFHALSWLFACDFYCFSTFSGPGKPENCIFCLNASLGICPATNSTQRSGVGARTPVEQWRWPQTPLPQVALVPFEWRWACTK